MPWLIWPSSPVFSFHLASFRRGENGNNDKSNDNYINDDDGGGIRTKTIIR